MCLLRPLVVDAPFNRGRVSTIVITALADIFNRYLSWKVRIYLKGNCPLKRRACLQPYRRNLIFFEHTSAYITPYVMYALAHGAVMVIQVSFVQFPPTVVFWLHNAIHFGFMEIWHGVLLPLQMTVPPMSKRKHILGLFQVNRPQLLEPRRYFEKVIKTPLQPDPPSNDLTRKPSHQRFSYLLKSSPKPADFYLAPPVTVSWNEDGSSVYYRKQCIQRVLVAPMILRVDSC